MLLDIADIICESICRFASLL